ncbi:uncharacterized protein EV420DRAFT_1554737 [Desarmillaria tabescens]|uniref:Uncharacterized protein n=1 Tax=Armillaria tabescens TaxID=1929756 RepID=A0AA39N2Q7_ARMTA|nr:uncharacterized protein EV420DRAFT_1554737 [Desarmillaria tabescens]KAK0455209.1 hypothetical protein EV420DRAFT_1554737 [Desarmillaria tabescens]
MSPHALSSKQERKLVDYLDDSFLNMMRGYKKRSQPSSHLPTLQLYLEAATKILSIILQIPPVDPSTSLRTSYLLHLTNDVLSSIVGYAPDPQNVVDLMDWLDDLDQAWLAVLQSQVWDPKEGLGVDLVIDVDSVAAGVKSSPLSQTERTRLRSLLLGGVETLEEWLFGWEGDGDSSENILEATGLQAAFDEVFSRTLDELGGLGGLNLDRITLDDSCKTERMDPEMEV